MSVEKQKPSTAPPYSRRIAIDWRLVAIVLVLTIAPFLLLASAIEAQVRNVVEKPMPIGQVWLIVAGLLWADIVLPIPSSVVSTFAGAKLGWFQAFLASDFVMMLASITAYVIGRLIGRSKLARLSHRQESIGQASVQSWGHWAIVVTRGIPLVAEVVLIYVAAKEISFRLFLATTLVANTAISLGYALLGQWASENEWLGIVLGASAILPLLLGVMVRRWLLAWTSPKEFQ
jgi:uncharacterized membrane protein YdjX (TVP38/TMEM64 family)